MRFMTKIVDYNGKAVIKFPKVISKAFGIKVGDKYTINKTSDGNIEIRFLRTS